MLERIIWNGGSGKESEKVSIGRVTRALDWLSGCKS